MIIKRYSDLINLQTFEERYEYLRVGCMVGDETFGVDRYLNQRFYKSEEWLYVRNKVILRDNGCDLGIKGREIHNKILIHHMNPITIDDIRNFNPDIIDPEYLISSAYNTHQAIHYGDLNSINIIPTERSKNDTSPWLKIRRK